MVFVWNMLWSSKVKQNSLPPWTTYSRGKQNEDSKNTTVEHSMSPSLSTIFPVTSGAGTAVGLFASGATGFGASHLCFPHPKQSKTFKWKSEKQTNSRSFRLNCVEICWNVGILLPLPLLAEGLERSLAFPLLPSHTKHGSLPTLLRSLQNNS